MHSKLPKRLKAVLKRRQAELAALALLRHPPGYSEIVLDCHRRIFNQPTESERVPMEELESMCGAFASLATTTELRAEVRRTISALGEMIWERYAGEPFEIKPPKSKVALAYRSEIDRIVQWCGASVATLRRRR